MRSEVLEQAKRQAEICRLFGNPTRLMILWVLRRGEMSVSEIADSVQSSLQNTSQHLRLMKDKGVLAATRQGNSVIYRLRDHEDMEGCRLLGLADEIERRQGVDWIYVESSVDKEA